MQHSVSCYSLVFKTDADLLLSIHFYFVFEHIEYIIPNNIVILQKRFDHIFEGIFFVWQIEDFDIIVKN